MYILDFFDPEITFENNPVLSELKLAYIKEFNDIFKNSSECQSCDIQSLRDRYLDILLKLQLN
jgi:hypothetical protein